MVRVQLLGPVRVYDEDATPVEVGGVRLRMLLARLALGGGRAVSADALVDGLWGQEPPADAANALQALASRLRKPLRGSAAVESASGGYRLSLRPEDVDVHRFEELAARGRRELAAGRADEAAGLLAKALGLWQGDALADVLDAPFAQPVATRLQSLRTAAAEDRWDSELQRGRYGEVLPDLEAAGAERPLSERVAGLRMRALSAAGRQSDALAVYEAIRERLGDELGVDPSAELRETHLALLRGELKAPRERAEPAVSRLPARLTSFVGRDGELDLVAQHLARGRLVTIVGGGGAGKTRLSLEAATRDRAHARGRVWFVPLAGVSAPDQLADAVLGALGSTDGALYEAGQGQRTTPPNASPGSSAAVTPCSSSTTASTSSRPPRNWPRRSCTSFPSCGSWPPAARPSPSPASPCATSVPSTFPRGHRSPPKRRSRPPCASSPTGPLGSGRTSRSTTSPSTPWSRCADASTGCRWPSNWPRRSSAR